MVVEKCPRTYQFCDMDKNGKCLSCGFTQKELRKIRNSAISLATYLYIYNHAWHECYINYMEGAKVLAKYLAPIDIKGIDIIIPDILVSYDLQQIAIVLKPHTTAPLSTNQIENAIYEHLTQLR